MLGDNQCAGSISRRSTGSGFGLTLAGVATCGLEAPEEVLEPQEAPIRFSDYYAWKLADLYSQDASPPEFELYWPPEKRDSALVKVRAWLESQSSNDSSSGLENS
jgi:hypothetical protein